jgi:CRP-like cAMP-binding protein
MQEQVAGAIPIDEIARTLALSPIFDRFDQGSLLAVAGKCGFATFEAGATIMRQGDPGNFAYLILEGEVDIFVEIPVGRIHMSTLGRGNTIGELGAFTDMPRTATAVARTDLVLLRTDREGLMSLAADFPVIAVTIVSELGQRLHSMNRPLAYLTYAATALARDEYDDAMLSELVSQQGELANFCPGLRPDGLGDPRKAAPPSGNAGGRQYPEVDPARAAPARGCRARRRPPRGDASGTRNWRRFLRFLLT